MVLYVSIFVSVDPCTSVCLCILVHLCDCVYIFLSVGGLSVYVSVCGLCFCLCVYLVCIKLYDHVYMYVCVPV